MMNHYIPQTWFRILIVILLILGIFLRFVNLDGKPYWQDEVYTIMKVVGLTEEEMNRELFKNQPISPTQLQQLHALNSNNTTGNMIRVLAKNDAKHPPLYFLMARFWMEKWGYSLKISRMLPALISVVSLPLMYLLALELFGKGAKLTAFLSMTVLGLSVIDIIYAQTARPYSLLTVCIIGSSWLLLRAYRQPTWQNWSLYALLCAVGLYTHSFFTLTLTGHLVFSIGYWLIKPSLRYKLLSQYLLAISASFLVYIPWFLALIRNLDQSIASVKWLDQKMLLTDLLSVWNFNLTSTFVSPYYDRGTWHYGLSFLFLFLIIISLYTVYTKADFKATLFLLTTIFIPFLILAIPNVFLGGFASAIPRYLVSCYPGIQLAVAYFLATQIQQYKPFWKVLLIVVYTSSLVFSTAAVFSNESRFTSRYNYQIAQILNLSSSAQLITDTQNGISLSQLVSLSYFLDQDVKIMRWKASSNFADSEQLKKIFSEKSNGDFFIFLPSEEFQLLLNEELKGELTPVFPQGNLWRWIPR